MPNYAAFWRPTGAGYFKRLTLPTLIELGTDLFGSDWAEQHQKDRKMDVVAWFDDFFIGPVPKDISAELQLIRDTWMPAGFAPEVAK